MLKPFIRASLYRLIYQFVLFIVSLLLAAISRAELFGVISLMIVNAAAFLILTDFGTGAALVWYGAGTELPSGKIFSFAAGSGVLQLFLFLVIEFFAIRLSGKTLLTRQIFTTSRFFSELIYITGLILVDKYTSLFYGKNKSVLANKTLSIVTAFFLILFLGMYEKKFNSIGSLNLFCLMIFTTGLGEAVIFHSSVQRMRLDWLNRPELKALIAFSAIVFITNIIQFFAYRLDFWLVDYFYSTASLGIYAQANRFAQIVWVLPAIVAALVTPAVRSHSLNDQAFLRLIRVLNLISFVIIVGVIAMALLFYFLFLEREYLKGLPALLFMLPGYFFFVTTTLLAAWFSAKRFLKINFMGSCLCFLTILVADLILIPLYSLKGAGLANTIAYAVTSVYFIVQFQTKGPGRIKDLYLWKKDDLPFFRKFIS